MKRKRIIIAILGVILTLIVSVIIYFKIVEKKTDRLCMGRG